MSRGAGDETTLHPDTWPSDPCRRRMKRHAFIWIAAIGVPIGMLAAVQLATYIGGTAGAVIYLALSIVGIVLAAAIGGIGVEHGHLLEAPEILIITVLGNIPWTYLLVWLYGRAKAFWRALQG